LAFLKYHRYGPRRRPHEEGASFIRVYHELINGTEVSREKFSPADGEKRKMSKFLRSINCAVSEAPTEQPEISNNFITSAIKSVLVGSVLLGVAYCGMKIYSNRNISSQRYSSATSIRS
jgi:hypothetical protein